MNYLFGEEANILTERDFQSLLVAAIIPVLGSALVSPVLDSLIIPLQTNPSTIGLLISVFTAPAIVIIPIIGVIADKYGRKRVLVASLIIFGISGGGIALANTFEVVLLLRFVQGVAFGGINPVIITSIGDLYLRNKEMTGQGLRFATSGLSGTVFPLIAGTLVLFNWRYPFLLYLIALPIAGLVYFGFREPTTSQKPSGNTVPGSYKQGLLQLLRRPTVLAVIIAQTLPPVIWFGFISYNSVIVIRVIGGSPLESGILVAVGSLVFAIGASQSGRLNHLLESRISLLLFANFSVALGFGIFSYSLTFLMAAIATLLIGLGVGLSMSIYRSIITGFTSERLRAGLVGIGEASGRVTGTLTPIIMGGGIGLLAPWYGFQAAIKISGVGISLGVGILGTICIYVYAKGENERNRWSSPESDGH